MFFGGLINYVLTHDRVFRDYVVAYTNAAILVREDFTGPEDLDGLFSGWQPRHARVRHDDLAVRRRRATDGRAAIRR